MRVRLFILALLLFTAVKPAFAGDPPTLISPSDNSIVASSKLEWQTPSYELYSSNPYRVQVDDDSNFSPSGSIYRDTYKSNTTYTPQLTNGTWYWRIKSKDASGTWSNWSNPWSFTLSSSTATPTPTLAPTASPTPSSNPTPAPTSTTSSISSIFDISNSPSQISSGQSFSINVSLSLPNSPNNNFYLKGAFKKSDGSNYFGFTKFSGNWVKNGSSYSSQYQITTDPSGNWSGNLEVQPDSEDSGFTGSGDYIFKVAKYTSSGSGPTWSNEVIINILESEKGSNQDTTSGQESINNFLSSSPTSLLQSNSISKNTPSPSSKSPSVKVTYKTASVAGATVSALPEIETIAKNKKPINLFNVIGISLVFAGIGSLGYIYWKTR